MNNFIKKQFNQLRSEWRDLTKEKREAEALLDIAWSFFYPEFLLEIKGKNIKNPFLEAKEVAPKKSSFFENEELKVKYRKAATLTHPDKTDGKIDSFKEISKARKEGCLNKFYDQLRSEKINIGELSFLEIEKMESEILQLKKDIEFITKSIYMEWFFAEDSKKKNNNANYYK